MSDHIESVPNQSGPRFGNVPSISDPAPPGNSDGITVGNPDFENRLNEYINLFQLMEVFGFNKIKNDELPTGYSWYLNAGWPRAVICRDDIYIEASFSPSRIEQRMNKTSRMLEDVRIPLTKQNPVMPSRPMAQEKPIAFYDLVLNYKPNKECDWGGITAELNSLAIREREMARNSEAQRIAEEAKTHAQIEARNNPTGTITHAISELVKHLNFKPMGAK